MTPPALCLVGGFPTARLPSTAEGKPGLRYPMWCCGYGNMWQGDGWPPTKRIQVIRCCKVLPLRPRPSSNGEGEEAESGVLPACIKGRMHLGIKMSGKTGNNRMARQHRTANTGKTEGCSSNEDE